MKWLFSVLTLCLVAGAAPAGAADLYQKNLNEWKTQVKDIEGREFKFLVDPGKLPPALSDGFKEIWKQAKEVAAKEGITMTEREKKPFELSPTVKTFLDTADMGLWKKGYLIRLTINYKNGYPVSPYRVVVKALDPGFKKALAAKLDAPKVKGKVSASENIGIGKDGQLSAYVEKDVSFSLGRAELGNMDLADFGAYVPELLKLGLPADTKLVAYPAFGVRCRPGFVQLPGLDRPVAFSMESWSRTPDGPPVVYDFSFAYEGDYAKMAEVHKAAEKFTLALYKDLNDRLGFKDTWRWGGSKVRLFFNQSF